MALPNITLSGACGFIHGIPGAPEWSFLDSTTCGETAGYPPFYVALFRVCGTSTCASGQDNAGLLEIVDAPTGSFADFISSTLQRNSAIGVDSRCLTNGSCLGLYRSASGHDIEFNLLGHAADSARSGIESIDGQREKNVDQWQFEEGDIMTAMGDGQVTINNIRLGSGRRT